MKDGVPTLTDYMTKNENGLSLDQMLNVQTMGNGPHLGMAELSLQRFARSEQREALKTWNQTDSKKYLLPTHSITDESEAKEAASIWTDISTYLGEARAKFITGEWNTTSDFDAYLTKLKEMKMDRYIEIRQKALDTYYGK